MKKIIIVNTSPRPKSNGLVIANRLQEKLGDAEVKLVDFRTADINYCKGCDACMKHDEPWCVQKDDMAALLPELDACDALVMITPVYWGTISAQAKTFVDRFYAFFNPAKENMTVATKFGKKTAVITTDGSTPIEAAEAEGQKYADAFGIAGFTENKVLSLTGLNVPGAVAENAADMAQVDELAAWLNA